MFSNLKIASDGRIGDEMFRNIDRKAAYKRRSTSFIGGVISVMIAIVL